MEATLAGPEQTVVQIPVTLTSEAKIPRYQSASAAGLDLCSVVSFELQPMERKLVPTGVRVAIPHGFEGQVRPRSGLALKYGISMVNAPGTIDSDYRGEIGVLLINMGAEAVAFEQGDRIAQLVISPVIRAELVTVEILPDTERGESGFGSTGHG
jgi:dUTP pyrophosphatase